MKRRIVYFSIFSVAILAIAVVTWMIQEGRIKIGADVNKGGRPICKNIGMRSEGWYDLNGLISYANCATMCQTQSALYSTSFPNQGYWYAMCKPNSTSDYTTTNIKLDPGYTSQSAALANVFDISYSQNCDYSSSEQEVTLNWDTMLPAINYILVRNVGAEYENNEITPTGDNATSHYVLRFPKNESRSYAIQNEFGLSNFVSISSCPTTQPTTTPTSTPTQTVSPSPTPTTTSENMTCAQKCATMGSATATCRSNAVILAPTFCANNEIMANQTSDCFTPEGLVGGGQGCCCSSEIFFNLSFSSSGNNLTINWPIIPDAESYDIFGCTSGPIDHIESNNFTINNLSDGEHCYIVYASDSNRSWIRHSDKTTINFQPNQDVDIVDREENTNDVVFTQSTSSLSLSGLVATGANIWINIFIALLFISGIGYFVFKDKIYKIK